MLNLSIRFIVWSQVHVIPGCAGKSSGHCFLGVLKQWASKGHPAAGPELTGPPGTLAVGVAPQQREARRLAVSFTKTSHHSADVLRIPLHFP